MHFDKTASWTHKVILLKKILSNGDSVQVRSSAEIHLKREMND